MAIGERIRFFRNLRGMTQKYLGQVVGFPEKTADIRMAQYESGSRTPKAELTETLARCVGRIAAGAVRAGHRQLPWPDAHAVYPGGSLRPGGGKRREWHFSAGRSPEGDGCCRAFRNAHCVGATGGKAIATAKSTGRTTTSGVITTRNMTKPPAM